jgi:hypothetical protein
MTELTIFNVIEQYHLFVKRANRLLQEVYQCKDVIEARRASIITRRGEIQGSPFAFHGTGCRIEIDGYIVDWDFGPDRRIDGFGAWKLWQFTRDHEQEFGEFAHLDRLRSDVTKLIENRQVYTMGDFGLTGNIVFFR